MPSLSQRSKTSFRLDHSCHLVQVLVATDDEADSLGVTLKEYHLSAVKEDVPLKPLPGRLEDFAEEGGSSASPPERLPSDSY
eukprot:g4497.t1